MRRAGGQAKRVHLFPRLDSRLRVVELRALLGHILALAFSAFELFIRQALAVVPHDAVVGPMGSDDRFAECSLCHNEISRKSTQASAEGCLRIAPEARVEKAQQRDAPLLERVRSCASLILSGRPSKSWPLSACMARDASAEDISTKPKPRARPVSRSLIRDSFSTVPYLVNKARTASSVAVNGRLPTYSFVINRESHKKLLCVSVLLGSGFAVC